MKAYVVLYEEYEDRDTKVLSVYSDEAMANSRVRWERDLIEANPDEKFRDECWYQESEII